MDSVFSTIINSTASVSCHYSRQMHEFRIHTSGIARRGPGVPEIPALSF